MGGPDPLRFSEEREISGYEDFHPHEHQPGRGIIHFSMRDELEGPNGSLCADTNADVRRNSSLRKTRG